MCSQIGIGDCSVFITVVFSAAPALQGSKAPPYLPTPQPLGMNRVGTIVLLHAGDGSQREGICTLEQLYRQALPKPSSVFGPEAKEGTRLHGLVQGS